MSARAAVVGVVVAIVGLVIAGCGDNSAAPDAGALDASTTCTATFSGNFAELTTQPMPCVTIAADPGTGHPTLAASLTTVAIGAPLDISIDLGASPTLGRYSSTTVPAWSAIGIHRFGNLGCFYSAGSATTPHGDFELILGELDPAAGVAHGVLTIDQHVLAFPFSDCGDRLIETVELVF